MRWLIGMTTAGRPERARQYAIRNPYLASPNESTRYRVPLFGFFVPKDQHFLRHTAGLHDLLPDSFVDAVREREFDLAEPEVASHGEVPVRYAGVKAFVALVARPEMTGRICACMVNCQMHGASAVSRRCQGSSLGMVSDGRIGKRPANRRKSKDREIVANI
jgi:hypothetical protein